MLATALNEPGELLHIGETRDFDARLADHVRDFAKISVDGISSVTFEVTEGKAAAKLILVSFYSNDFIIPCMASGF